MLQFIELPALAGYTFRCMQGEADLPEMVKVINAAKQADGLHEVTTLESMTNQYRHLPNSDPARDVVVVEAADGLAAYGRTFWLKQDLAEVYMYPVVAFVRPEHRRRGVGTALLGWLEARARQMAEEEGHPPTAEAYLQAFVYDSETARAALFQKHGYVPERYFYEMERPNLDDIPAAPLPPGLEVRPVRPEHLQAIWDANVEAFRDHWGEPERTAADYERWLNDPVEFQPDIWKVAWDMERNEVVGMVLGFINHAENAALGRKRGWTENICVRRPWRKLGVARALIAENLRELKARGMEHAALGVDTDNPTGALRVYESMGFRPVAREVLYQKPLRSTETAR
jgi:mycothiol synthase